MTTWVNAATGETLEADCAFCESTRLEAEAQISSMERELRGMRAAKTRAENKLEAATVAHRDAKVWKRLLDRWLTAFPDKRPSSTGVKSARATKAFLRLEAGATVEEFEDAIIGAWAYPYVVFGKRVKTGSRTDLADDIADIASVNNDANFDWLRDVGAKLRGNQ